MDKNNKSSNMKNIGNNCVEVEFECESYVVCSEPQTHNGTSLEYVGKLKLTWGLISSMYSRHKHTSGTNRDCVDCLTFALGRAPRGRRAC